MNTRGAKKEISIGERWAFSDFFWGAPGLPGGAPDHFGMPGGGARPRAPPLFLRLWMSKGKGVYF